MADNPNLTSDFQRRQAFALRLSDALRSIADPAEIQRVAMNLLGNHLRADRAQYYRAEHSQGSWFHIFDHDFHAAPGTFSIANNPRPVHEYGAQLLSPLFVGETVHVYDVRTDPRLEPAERAMYAGLDLQAFIAVPLIKGEKYVGGVSVHSARARQWTSSDLELVADVAERTWSAMERAAAQTAMRESEERLRLAIDIGELASWDWEIGSGRVTWNDRHFLMQGYKVGEVVPGFEAWINRVHPDDRAETLRLLEKARDSLVPYVHEFRVMYPDGSVHWCSARGHFFYDEQGAPRRMIGVMRDITEQKRAQERARAREAALRDVEHRFRQFAAASSCALWVRDAQTLALQYSSPAVTGTFGVPPAELLGEFSRWNDFVLPEDRTLALEHLDRARRGESVMHEFRIRRAGDREVRWIHCTDFPLFDDDGQVSGIGGIAEDVTETRAATPSG